MGASETRRLLSPEEIAAQSPQQVPFIRLPKRESVFADRETRLRQLAASHPMRDYLLFLADLTHAQHLLLQNFPAIELPSFEQVKAAQLKGKAPILPIDMIKSAHFMLAINAILKEVSSYPLNTAVKAQITQMQSTSDEVLYRQAERLLSGVMVGLDMAAVPFIAAALQTYWTHLVIATNEQHEAAKLVAFDRVDDVKHCPCCGSRPTASITRIGTESGSRYLQCSLCSTQWHMVRIQCAHCESSKSISYQSLEPLAEHQLPATGAAKDAVQAEVCDDCGHYLKIVHMEKDPYVDAAADDLASITLDLLVSEEGRQRYGVNLLLLFGDPEPPPGSPPGGH